MLEIIQGIMGLGAEVMLPIVMTILGLIFRMKLGRALKAGLMVGFGFKGLQLVIGLLMTTVDPAIAYYQGLDTSGFTTVDVGWAAMGAASWSVPFAAPAILLIVIMNILLVLTKRTRVLNVDIWNYIHFLIPGTLAYALSGSAIIGLIVTVGLSIITLFVAEKIAPKWTEYYGLEGTTCSTFSFITFAYPFGVLVNKIIDKIPGLKDVDISLESVGEKFRFFGDTAIIGVIVGFILGILTKQSWQTVLIMGIGIGSVLVLLPKMVSVMMEGLSAVGAGAQEFMKDKIGEDSELYIGMDIALGLGDPTAITTTVILIPLAILFAFIIPNMSYFPVGILTVIVYMIPLIAMASNGNLLRTLIGSALFLLVVEVCANVFAPEATAMMHATGVAVEGTVTDGFFGFNLANVIISLIHSIIG
ncbi:PTS transporter subunit IIC [Tepidimicrobium xylanilyticum]|uniref:PTS system, galactitol-specific IIC component n=1 Tax=Tepidimicrobium xylanilyticum TaxID=1123352 RepID=A0A1H2QNZ3_9FIRM|nr:PTS transporter subunit IIC [Tepidimicrobium xylanilyticum]SDW08913.1 PTS system, galactitol-specific IIC component [Tepidimicrobium xylanilyticum]